MWLIISVLSCGYSTQSTGSSLLYHNPLGKQTFGKLANDFLNEQMFMMIQTPHLPVMQLTIDACIIHASFSCKFPRIEYKFQ